MQEADSKPSGPFVRWFLLSPSLCPASETSLSLRRKGKEIQEPETIWARGNRRKDESNATGREQLPFPDRVMDLRPVCPPPPVPAYHDLYLQPNKILHLRWRDISILQGSADGSL
jgi:hypothetical protein